jgi:hypothetical protein
MMPFFIMGIRNQETLFIEEGVRTLLAKVASSLPLGFCLFATSTIEFVN